MVLSPFFSLSGPQWMERKKKLSSRLSEPRWCHNRRVYVWGLRGKRGAIEEVMRMSDYMKNGLRWRKRGRWRWWGWFFFSIRCADRWKLDKNVENGCSQRPYAAPSRLYNGPTGWWGTTMDALSESLSLSFDLTLTLDPLPSSFSQWLRAGLSLAQHKKGAQQADK